MTTPTEKIAALDRVLSQSGENVQVQRPISATDVAHFSATADCRAFVRPYEIGLVNIIMSPTDLAEAGWPGQSHDLVVGDPIVPRKTDKVLVAGRQRSIENVHPFYYNSILVRLEIEASA